MLFIFAVMVTRRDQRTRGPQFEPQLVGGALMAGTDVFRGWFSCSRVGPGFSKTAAVLPPDFDAVDLLGGSLISPDAYVLPFEVASVLFARGAGGALYTSHSNRK